MEVFLSRDHKTRKQRDLSCCHESSHSLHGSVSVLGYFNLSPEARAINGLMARLKTVRLLQKRVERVEVFFSSVHKLLDAIK